ncbi:hypothetical protein STAL104432_00865 [Streptomyces albus]
MDEGRRRLREGGRRAGVLRLDGRVGAGAGAGGGRQVQGRQEGRGRGAAEGGPLPAQHGRGCRPEGGQGRPRRGPAQAGLLGPGRRRPGGPQAGRRPRHRWRRQGPGGPQQLRPQYQPGRPLQHHPPRGVRHQPQLHGHRHHARRQRPRRHGQGHAGRLQEGPRRGLRPPHPRTARHQGCGDGDEGGTGGEDAVPRPGRAQEEGQGPVEHLVEEALHRGERPHRPGDRPDVPGAERPGTAGRAPPRLHPPCRVRLPARPLVRPLLDLHSGPAAGDRRGGRRLRLGGRPPAVLPAPRPRCADLPVGGRGADAAGAHTGRRLHPDRARHRLGAALRPAGRGPGRTRRRHRPHRTAHGPQRPQHHLGVRPDDGRAAAPRPQRRLRTAAGGRGRPGHFPRPRRPGRRHDGTALRLHRRQSDRGRQLVRTAVAFRVRRRGAGGVLDRHQRPPLRLRLRQPAPVHRRGRHRGAHAGPGRLRRRGRGHRPQGHGADDGRRPHDPLRVRRARPADRRDRPLGPPHPHRAGPVRPPAVPHRSPRPHHPLRLRRGGPPRKGDPPRRHHRGDHPQRARPPHRDEGPGRRRLVPGVRRVGQPPCPDRPGRPHDTLRLRRPRPSHRGDGPPGRGDTGALRRGGPPSGDHRPARRGDAVRTRHLRPPRPPGGPAGRRHRTDLDDRRPPGLPHHPRRGDGTLGVGRRGQLHPPPGRGRRRDPLRVHPLRHAGGPHGPGRSALRVRLRRAPPPDTGHQPPGPHLGLHLRPRGPPGRRDRLRRPHAALRA